MSAQNDNHTNSISIPGYTIHGKIAAGGMATVYRATQESLDREVALKILRPIGDPRLSQRFLNEGRTVAALNHPNVITIYDIGVAGELHYISMELLGGGSLADRMKGHIEPDYALELLKILADCLGYVHRHGVVHRDIKPANILFRENGTPVLTDFGIAKTLAAESGLTLDNTALGSPHYLSPEQAQSQKLDGRTDIYSLGIVFYEMITGARPFNGKTAIDTIMAQIQNPVPELPAEHQRFQKLLQLMLAKKPERRFPSAAELVKFVSVLARKTSADADPAATVAIPVKKRARKKASADSALEPTVVLKQGHSPPKPAGKPGRKRRRRGLVFASLSIAALAAGVAFIPFDEPPFDQLSLDALPFSEILRTGDSPAKPAHARAPTADAPVAKTAAEPGLARDTPATDEPNAPTPPAFTPVEQAPSEHTVATSPGDEQAPSQQARVSDDSAVRIQKQTEQRVMQHLLQARLAFAEEKFIVPLSESALYHYNEVLTLQSENGEAAQGITNIAHHYADRAQAKLGSSLFDEAKTLIDRGMVAQPQNARLLSLKQQTLQAKQDKIDKRLQQAHDAFAQQKLLFPPKESAYYHFNQVLAIQPDNAKANNGLNDIANRYLTFAQTKLDQSRFDETVRLIDRGLKVRPRHERLLALKQKAVAVKAHTIKTHLRKARQAYSRDNLMDPQKDSAYHHYKQVLEVQSDHPGAHKGLADIANRYAVLAQAKLDKFEYDDAKTLIDRGLTVKPKHERLLVLKEEAHSPTDAPRRAFRKLKSIFE